MKKLMLTALALPLLLLVFACTDAGDPYIPGGGEVSEDVTITVSDYVGDWDALFVDGDLTDDPVGMTQDGIVWTATVNDLAPGDYDYGIYYDDGTGKALVAVLENLTVTVSGGGEVSGDLSPDLEPTADTGFNLVVINNNPAYDNIMIKGEMNEWTNEITGNSEDGVYWYLHVEAGLAADDYEWGVVDVISETEDVWLLPGDNLVFTIDAEGLVSGTTTFEIPEATAPVNVTFQVDMSEETVSGDGVFLAGGFGPEGYPDWDPAGLAMTDDDEDQVYETTLELSSETTYEFKFVNGGSWESVPSDCGVDDDFGGYNRSITTGTDDMTFTAPFGACPTTR